jgi:hypothetical protein
MPYIEQNYREGAATAPLTPGELNYAFTKLIDGYLAQKGLTYAHINDCLGALEGAKLEFYRRVAVPYENDKRAANGDVYTVVP